MPKLGRRAVVSKRCRRTAVIAVLVAVELASAGLTIGVEAAAPGMSTVVTVSVDGATGTWAPADRSRAEPETAAVGGPATTPPVPTWDQTAIPATAAVSETTSTSTAPVEEPSRPSEREPTTRSR